jgi:hypothetical protein
MTPPDEADHDVLQTRVRVPEHVVLREFPDETVVLNLDSGMYHGLNRTAAKMLEVLGSAASVDEAVGQLAGFFDQPREVISRDLLTLCDTLRERGLITDHAVGGG